MQQKRKIAKFEIKLYKNIITIYAEYTPHQTLLDSVFGYIATTVSDLTTRPVYACFAIPL